jgi:holliday junction DNA helicase RuvB
MDGIAPAAADERTHNPLRPARFDEIVGQDKAKALMRRAIESCYERRRPMDHVLLVGASGTGKSTFSHVIANELGSDVDIYSVEAPVSTDMLAELRTKMWDGDILMIEEIHQQAIMERRGRSAATQPEVLYAVMEDRVLQSPTGPLAFPRITIIGTTTDEGMLPDAFINRFPLRPRLVAYTREQLRTIVRNNARTLDVSLDDEAVALFANASRGVPREVNNLVKNAAILCPPGDRMTAAGARDVLEINGIAHDGLTPDMQNTLTFLYTRARRVGGDGEVRYQASVNTIATAIGKSRDSKAVALRVEPYLIEKGFLQVSHAGRILTDAGVARAQELIT